MGSRLRGNDAEKLASRNARPTCAPARPRSGPGAWPGNPSS